MDTKIATVGKTGFIAVDYRYYSIPYKYIDKKLRVMYTA